MYQEKELKEKEGLQTNHQQQTVGTPPIQLASAIGNQAMLQLIGLKKQKKKPNTTGIPDQMKQNFEEHSGLSFDDVRVHYNSDKPAQLQALAYTQGNQVYVGPGQEKHLGHELGHVVQQKQGRVRATTNVKDVAVNDDRGLEREADNIPTKMNTLHQISTNNNILQLKTANDIITDLDKDIKTYYSFQEEDINETIDITFGVELEVEHPAIGTDETQGKIGDNNKHIKKSISDAKSEGLTNANEMDDTVDDGKWKPVSDGTLNTKQNTIYKYAGIEWVSPILHTKESDWTQIKKICNIIEGNEGIITDACSEHIHIGNNKLDTNDKYKSFYFLYEGFQDIINVIARSNFGIPKTLRSKVENEAESMKLKHDIIFPDENLEIDLYKKELYKAIFENDEDSRKNAINIKTGKPTIEIRRFNGTFDPKVIQANALLSTSLMKKSSSTESAIIKQKVEDCKSMGINERLSNFVDFITSNEKVKEILIYAYNANINPVPLSSPDNDASLRLV